MSWSCHLPCNRNQALALRIEDFLLIIATNSLMLFRSFLKGNICQLVFEFQVSLIRIYMGTSKETTYKELLFPFPRKKSIIVYQTYWTKAKACSMSEFAGRITRGNGWNKSFSPKQLIRSIRYRIINFPSKRRGLKCCRIRSVYICFLCISGLGCVVARTTVSDPTNVLNRISHETKSTISYNVLASNKSTITKGDILIVNII